MLKELRDLEDLKDKTIKNIEYTNTGLIIVFDDSFICFNVKYEEIAQEDFNINDFSPYEIIKLGIYTQSEYNEYINQITKKRNEAEKMRQYELYLKLKEQFEFGGE